MEKLDLFSDLRKIQTVLNCMEYTLIRATVGNMNDAAAETFDLLALILDHVDRMVDKAGRQRPDGKEGAAA